MQKKHLAWIGIVVGLIIAFALAGGPASAARLITGHDIKNGSITRVDTSKGMQQHEINQGQRFKRLGAKTNDTNDHLNYVHGKVDATAKDLKNLSTKVNGIQGITGSYYALAKYNAGDTNQGAIATVACSKESDVAVSGGVQMIGLGGKNSAVGSSFPGRMDWSTNTPKDGRLDGWIVQFDAAAAPEKATLWALCVPGATVPTVTTYAQQ